MASKSYSIIRKKYPGTIRFDDVCAILHYSKRKTKWMLEEGWIKAEIADKKTRRYSIQTEDFIAFLIDMDEHPEKYQFPMGAFSSESIGQRKKTYTLKTEEEIREGLELLWSDYPGVLTMDQIKKTLGFSSERINYRLHLIDASPIVCITTLYYPKKTLIDALSINNTTVSSAYPPRSIHIFMRKIK